MIGKKVVCLLSIVMICISCLYAQNIASDWKLVKNEAFSFYLPKGFKKKEAHGIDSYVENYKSKYLDVSFDYGINANDFHDWPLTTKYEVFMVDGLEAKIGTAEESFGHRYKYSTQIHFYLPSQNQDLSFGVLSMFASCSTEKEISLAHQIFKTIRFKKVGSSVIPVEATRYSVTKKKQKNDNLGDQAKVFEKYEKK